MTTPAFTAPVVPVRPIVREPQRDLFDDPEIPLPVRWYLRLTSYVTHPGVLFRAAPLRTAGTLVPLMADHEWRIAAPLLAYMAGAERSLVERGFAEPLRAINGISASERSFVSFAEHTGHATLGFVFVSEGEHTTPYALATFRTDFADGVQLVTTNAHMVMRTPSRPAVLGVRVRDVHDVGALYDLHRFRVTERARTTAPSALTRGADPIAFQDAEAAETFAFWVRVGYYRTAGPSALRLTRRGACLAAWRGLFPWKQLTAAREDRTAAALLRRYEAARGV